MTGIMRTVALVPVIALVLADYGCGSSDTVTITKQATDTSSDPEETESVGASGPEPPVGFTGGDLCGRFPGGFERQPLHLWARGVDCEVARKLSKQVRDGTGLPSAWNCGASAIGCSNEFTGSEFYVASVAGPGEQNCPAGQIAVGDDSCGPRDSGGQSRSPTIGNGASLSTEGLGPVLVGMSVAEASKAAGVQLVPSSVGANPSCQYYEVAKLPDVGFMVSHGEVARVDVRSREIRTLSGVRVGDSAGDLVATYGERLSSELGFYDPTATNYTFTPEDPSDKTRMIFVTGDDGVIESIQAGRLPEVGYVEACS